ncbi:hypothetical protein NE237_000817 [Protea cynaroides]|uniref:Uncharacterized protein n=1 Tax=Protea cynaroides TaxID=273540 RepID=A0A9Q0KSZ3_9MAGN|nr:hypothetical protein NE237_000817 [Protea cynaroides]
MNLEESCKGNQMGSSPTEGAPQGWQPIPPPNQMGQMFWKLIRLDRLMRELFSATDLPVWSFIGQVFLLQFCDRNWSAQPTTPTFYTTGPAFPTANFCSTVPAAPTTNYCTTRPASPTLSFCTTMPAVPTTNYRTTGPASPTIEPRSVEHICLLVKGLEPTLQPQSS